MLFADDLPTFGGTLSLEESEALLSYLTVPYCRVPLVCGFFAARDRSAYLMNGDLQALFTAVLFEGGAWVDPRAKPAAVASVPLRCYGGASGGFESGGGGSSGGVGRARALAYTRSLLADACALLRARWLPAGGGFGVAPESFAGPMALVALPEALWRRPGDVGAAANDATSADAKRVQVWELLQLHVSFRLAWCKSPVPKRRKGPSQRP